MSMISIKNFTKQFHKKKIFDQFDLAIEQGEMVALVGPSGCGKTTLLNVIGLIDTIGSGEYELFGKKVPKSNTAKANELIRKHISYLFQNFALVDYFTVEKNLMMALYYTKQSRAEKQALISNVLKNVGLEGYEKAKVYELSGGEQQRVSVARAIIKPSDIILADEPTGSLDVKNRDEILGILSSLNQEGKTIIIVTHDTFVASQCDRSVELG